MKNIKLLAIVISACILFSSEANAWFLIIPGALIDTVLGVKGEHCVEKSAKVGDIKDLQNGNSAEIIGFSWLDKGCSEPTPRRAELKFSFFKSKAILKFPNTYKVNSDAGVNIKLNGWLLKARRNSIEINVYTRKISSIANVTNFTDSFIAKKRQEFKEVFTSNEETINVGDNKVVVNIYTGSRKGYFGIISNSSVITAVIPTDYELLLVSIDGSLKDIEENKTELLDILKNITFSKENSIIESSKSASDHITDSPASKSKTGGDYIDEKLPSNLIDNLRPTDKPINAPKLESENSSPKKSISEKLRELNLIYKDGLITKDEFELKKKELLEQI